MMGRRADINLTGKTFNLLTVIGEAQQRKGNKPAWLCLCTCGKECLFTTTELLSGRAKSCGHLRGLSRALDLTDMVFGDLTAKYYAFTKDKKRYWHCICTCGEECDVITSDLTMGLRKDCGHSHDAYMHETRTKDITSETFGYLNVIEMLPSIRTGNKWRAMCRVECLLCGNIIDVQCDYIKSGDTQSCGCLKSKGEQEVLSYLLEHNINHKTQYSFEDLLTPKGGRCYFDFAIFEHDKLKCLIEYQGEQHFHEMPDTPWKFGQFAREISDPLKREYCKRNNIQLYEINYNQNTQEELDKIFAC